MTLAAFQHRMGAGSLGERQAGMDQRFDAAGGEVVEQHAVRCRADVRAIVEAMDREENAPLGSLRDARA